MSKEKIQKAELLPEERVRQWFLALLERSGVEKFRMSTEYAITVSGRTLRVDIVIFGRASREIIAIVECKAPSVQLTSKVISQAAVYNTVTCARYIIVTNGNGTFIYDTYTKEFLADLPRELFL